jgi:mannitol 2-dehydrogenase
MQDVMPAGDEPVPLDEEHLGVVAAGGRVEVPRYDRTRLVTGIVHVGVGGFHRAHQAMAVDRLLSLRRGEDFAICGVGLLPQDQRVGDVLVDQDFLYTLMLKHADGGRDARVIGSIVDFLFAPRDPDAVIERMARPETRIVSLTITEGGYNVDPTTGGFFAGDHGVQHDLANPDAPVTAFGFVTAPSPGAGHEASRRSRSCRATTSRTTGASRAAASSPSRVSRTPGSGTGWPSTSRSRAAWSTASLR